MNAPANLPAPTNHEFRHSTDAAGLCGAIVKQTAKNIQGRKYVSVEGWQAIAIAHGCAASALEVERVSDEGMSGFKCVGTVRRMEDGQEIARAEGFLGDDERTWSSRPVYARRAMVQTRAISRACRSAFAHVVVMIDAGLSTTPAEEVPDGGFVEGQYQEVQSAPAEPVYGAEAPTAPRKGWREDGSPYSTPTKLHGALNRLDRELMGCGDSDMIYAVTMTDEWKEFVRVAEKHSPHYLRGGDPAPPEFEGLLTKAERLVAEFDSTTANNMADLARV
jgi:hypothetical protein